MTFFKKKQNALNSLRGKINLTFLFSLSGVLNVRGGWVGSDVWDKVLKKTGFFFDTFPKKVSHYTLTMLLGDTNPYWDQS